MRKVRVGDDAGGYLLFAEGLQSFCATGMASLFPDPTVALYRHASPASGVQLKPPAGVPQQCCGSKNHLTKRLSRIDNLGKPPPASPVPPDCLRNPSATEKLQISLFPRFPNSSKLCTMSGVGRNKVSISSR